jgi:hypothetical protein
VIRYAYLLSVLVFVGLVAAKFESNTGFTSLIRFGATWQDKRHGSLHDLKIATVADSNGYDGQFYAQVALDPLLRGNELETTLDAPAYRARRILTPATAAILGFGNPWWTLQIFALLNVFCWLALAGVLRTWIEPNDWAGFARWFGCMFSLGVLDSVRQSLVDLPALLLLALAIRSSLKSHAVSSTLWLALANLAKETSGLGTIALVDYRSRHWKRGALAVFLATLPLILWSFYVGHRFRGLPDAPGGQQNFAWPLVAMFSEITKSIHELANGNFDGRYLFGLLAMAGFTAQIAVIWRIPQPTSAWWKVGALYSLLFLVLGPWVWSGYWAACRAVLPLTFAFNLLQPANRFFWPIWITGNITVLHGIWRFI